MNRRATSRWTTLLLLVATTALVWMTVRTRGEVSDKVVLKLAHSLDIAHPVHHAMVFMAKRLAEKSGGQVVIEIFPSEQLGSEREYIEQVQLGCLDMAKSSVAALEQFVPEMSVFGVPYVFRSKSHCEAVQDGPLGQEILSAGGAVGIKGLCYFDAGARSFYTTDRSVHRPADLEKMKIRVQKSKTAMKLVQALGAAPTPIAFGELYTALQQGVVDGAENNPPSFYHSKHYEVCKYYTLDEHARVPDVLFMSTVAWERLSHDVQRMLMESVFEATVFQRKLWAEKTAQALKEVEAAGVEVIYPEKRPFEEKVRPMHEAYQGTDVGAMIDRIQEIPDQGVPALDAVNQKDAVNQIDAAKEKGAAGGE